MFPTEEVKRYQEGMQKSLLWCGVKWTIKQQEVKSKLTVGKKVIRKL